MLKFLLIGSAPYMPEWWSTYGENFRKEGYIIVAINNSWRVPIQLPDEWIKPSNYFRFSPKAAHPKKWEIKKMKVINENIYKRKFGFPVKYHKKGTGTMLLDSLVYLINKIIRRSNKKGIILIAGCDLDYPDGNTHFYKGGSKDPLRMGIQWIETELDKLHVLVSNNYPNIKIYNVGKSEKSILPFFRL
jgi:hypothetical protein